MVGPNLGPSVPLRSTRDSCVGQHDFSRPFQEVTELFQMTVPGRGPELEDLLANGVGSVVGGLSAWTVRLWIINALMGLSD